MDIKAIIAELDALTEKATPAPWRAEDIPYDGVADPCIWGPDDVYVAQTVYDMQSISQVHDVNADTRLIIALRNHWPAIREALATKEPT